LIEDSKSASEAEVHHNNANSVVCGDRDCNSRLADASDNKAVLKCKHPEKGAKAVHKVTKTKSKKRIGQSQEEFRQNETDILSRVIQLERELGCQPGLLDLLCRFSRAEIDAVWDSLIWLYPDLMSKGATVPELVIA
jgi:hypothetical protein